MLDMSFSRFDLQVMLVERLRAGAAIWRFRHPSLHSFRSRS